MPSKEQVYTKQLQELGIWEAAFAPLVKDLSQAERQRTRAQKEWSDKAKAEAEEKGADPAKAKPSFSDELWAVICDLDKKILAYREALGLTPKALRRLRGQPTAALGVQYCDRQRVGDLEPVLHPVFAPALHHGRREDLIRVLIARQAFLSFREVPVIGFLHCLV